MELYSVVDGDDDSGSEKWRWVNDVDYADDSVNQNHSQLSGEIVSLYLLIKR